MNILLEKDLQLRNFSSLDNYVSPDNFLSWQSPDYLTPLIETMCTRQTAETDTLKGREASPVSRTSQL